MAAIESAKLVVVSDLHLAPGLPGNPAFQAFLDHLSGGPDCHLVVAGDLFDLLAAADPTKPKAFDADNAARLLRDTVRTHGSLFSALTRFARKPGNKVTVIGGNHDAVICLPAARLVLRRLLGSRIHWLVHGEAVALSIGGLQVLIEHGDLYDDWNRVDYAPLVVASRLHSRGETPDDCESPPGAYVVTRFLNGLRPKYQWLEWIKPETALVPLLHALLSPRERLRLMTLIGPYLTQARRSTERRLLRVVRGELPIRGAPAVSTRQCLRAWYRETLKETTRAAGVSADDALIVKLRRRVMTDGFFDPYTPDAFAAELMRLDRLRTFQLVILGHSHAAKALPLLDGLLYLNSGAWCPLVQLPASDAHRKVWIDFLHALRSNSLLYRWRSTCVAVEATTSGCDARLLEWTSGATRPLAHWRWDRRGTWRLEL